MTLTEIVDAHPDLFYEGSGWWRGPGFAMRPLRDGGPIEVPILITPPAGGRPAIGPYFATQLVDAYVRSPGHPLWRYFIWCKDQDLHGQQVYVGGVGQFGIDRFQIHRHLRIDERWVTPL